METSAGIGGITFKVETGLVRQLAIGGCCAYGIFAAVRWARASSLRVNLNFARTPVGFFSGPFGKVYYRDAPGGTLYEAVPRSVKLRPGSRLAQEPVEYELHEVVTKDKTESLVLDSPAPREAVGLPAFAVELGIELAGKTVRIVGMGTRVGNYLMTAHHMFEKPGKMGYGTPSFIVSHNGRSVRVDRRQANMRSLMASNGTLYDVPSASATWFDLAFYELSQREWAAIGARALKPTELSLYGDSNIEVFGRPGNSLLVSSGYIVEDYETERTRGVFTHTANTVETYSGSPVVVMHKGTTRLVGMHVAGGNNVNYAITSKAILKAMRSLSLEGVPSAGLLNFGTVPISLVEQLGAPVYQSDRLESREARRQFADVDEEAYYIRKTKKEHRAEGIQMRRDEVAAGGVTDHDGRRVYAQRAEVAELTQIDRRLAGDTAQERGLAEHLGSLEGRLRGSKWADMEDDYDETVSAEEQDDAFIDWLHLMIAKPAPFVEDGWVRRVGSYALLGRGTTNKIIARLVATGRLCAVQCRGEAWIHFPSPAAAQEPVKPAPVPAPGLGSIAEEAMWPVPTAPPPPTASTCTPSVAGYHDQSITLGPRGEVPLHIAARDEALSRDSVAEEEVPRLTPVAPEIWGPQHLPYHHKKDENKLKWAKHTSECRPPVAKTELTPEQFAAFTAYTQSADLHDLAPLYGVGASTLLENPWFGEYRKYLASGNRTMWAKTDDRAKNKIFNAKGELHAQRVGSCEKSFGKSKPGRKISPAFAAALRKLNPSWRGEDIAEHVCSHELPPTGPEAISDSFRGQCERQKPGNWDKLLEEARFDNRLREFVGQYPATQTPLRNGLLEAVDAYCDSVDKEKSSGWSARYRPGSKGAWTTTSEGRSLLAYLVQARLALRYAEGENIHFLSPSDQVSLGLRDPEEVFVKAEGHCGKKVKAKRWRLIWICSIVDSCAQDALHHGQNKADIAAYASGRLHVQAVGLGHHDAGIERLGQTFDRMTKGAKQLRGSDASGWDLSCCRDSLYFDTERRVARLATYDPVIAALLWAEAATNTSHVLVIGTALWSFTFFGVTASGIPSTSAQNSPVRAFMLEVCGADEAMAAGDDEVHTGDVDLELLSSAGTLTKEGSECVSGPEGPVSFTSHIFTKVDGRWTAEFDNLPKMLAALDLRRPDDETPPEVDSVAGMRFALRHTPAADSIFVAVCNEMGWPLAAAAPLPYEE